MKSVKIDLGKQRTLSKKDEQTILEQGDSSHPISISTSSKGESKHHRLQNEVHLSQYRPSYPNSSHYEVYPMPAADMTGRVHEGNFTKTLIIFC